jgi:hypothetical protein
MAAKVDKRDKRAKFIDLANKRVTRAIREIKLVGNLANKSNYQYSDEDAKKIVRALQKEIETLKGRFSEGGAGGAIEFRLDR